MSSLNAGVAGLSANASRLATISDNIANSATKGYKRAESEFHSMVNGQGSGSYSAGGVRVSSQRHVDQSGALTSTSSPTDLAIHGRGFLPVISDTSMQAGAQQMMLTTTGSFRTDENGVPKTAAGHVLMGWPADANGKIPINPRDTTANLKPIVIDNAAFTAVPTSEVSLGLNLPATETGPATTGTSQDISVEYFDNLGSSKSLNFGFVPQAAERQWNLTITDKATDNVVGDYQLTFASAPGTGGVLQSITGNAPYDDVAAGEPVKLQTGAGTTSTPSPSRSGTA